jgi:thiamine kinase
MSESPEAALASIPGWESGSCSQLSGGLTNRTWLVSLGDRKAVLKVDNFPRVPPFNDRFAEKRIQTMAAAAGLANNVLFANERVYLTEYIEGKVWTAEDIAVENNLRDLAALLRRLHSQALSGRHFDAIDAAEGYVAKIRISESATARHCIGIVKKLHAPMNLCCCHNDLVAGNFIATPGLRLLDWEYACDNDPLFDLAIVVAQHQLTEAHARFFLDSYFDGDGERWYEKLTQQMALYNALVWLWYASRPNPEPDQMSVFESRLTTSCS